MLEQRTPTSMQIPNAGLEFENVLRRRQISFDATLLKLPHPAFEATE